MSIQYTFLITILISAFAQLKAQQLDSLKNYSIDLAQQGQYTRAIQIMDDVYHLAKIQRNEAMMVGALYYKIKWITHHQENLLDSLMMDCEEISRTNGGLLKNFSHLWLSNIYQQYYWNNKDVVAEEISTEKDASSNFRHWSKSRLFKAVEFHLNAALKGDLNVAVMDFREFIDVPDVEEMIYRPTLYEVFFDRWLEFYEQQSQIKDVFSEEELQIDTLLFSNHEVFKLDNGNFAGKHTYMKRILYQYGIFLQYQLEKGRFETYLDYEVSRLKMVLNYSLHPDKEKYFLEALQRLIQDKKCHAAAHLAYAEIGEYTFRVKGDAEAAIKICTFTEQEFPGSYGAKKCHLIRNDIIRPDLIVTGKQVALPKDRGVSYVTLKNIPKLFLKIVKIPALLEVDNDDPDIIKSLMESFPTVFASSYDAIGNAPFASVILDIKLPQLALGKYLLIWSDKLKSENWSDNSPVVTQILHVSRLGSFNYSSKDSLHMVVFDRKSGIGKPGVNVKINTFEYAYEGLKISGTYFLRSNKTGLAALKWEKPNLIKTTLWKGVDTLQLENHQFASTVEKGDRSNRFIELFTDRSIYRPGQMVYFKGLLLNDPGTGVMSTLSYKSVELVLYDASHEKIISGNFISNTTGAFSGSFIIPEGRLLGTYYLQATTSDGIAGARALRIEAYKRPSFYIEMQHHPKIQHNKDSLYVSGKVLHFDLSPLAGARFTYQIYRMTPPSYLPNAYRRAMPSGFGNLSLYLSGGGIVENNGDFTIHFKDLYPKLSGQQFHRYALSYRVEVTVTDVNGESHFVKMEIYPQEDIYQLNVSWPKTGDVYRLKPLKIALTSSRGPSNGLIKLFRLKKDAVQLCGELRQKYRHIQGFDPWAYLQQHKDSLLHMFEANLIYEAQISDSSRTSIQEIIDGGIYVLNVIPEESLDKNNPLVSVHMFSDIEKGVPLGDAYWSFLAMGETFIPGQVCTIKCAGKHRSQQVFVFIEKNGVILATYQTMISSVSKMAIPIKLQYTGDVFVHLIYIRNGAFFRDTLKLSVPLQNRKINLELISDISSFKPGSDVTFKFKIDQTGIDIEKTEFLACMYDASLDQFTPHVWNTRFDQSAYTYLILNSPGFDVVFGNYVYPGWNFKQDTSRFSNRKYPIIKWPGQVYQQNDQVFDRNGGLLKTAMQPDFLAASESTEKDIEPDILLNTEGRDLGVIIRKDFRETAFFYPHLQIAQNGEIEFQCKIPDALTKWRFLLFAHSAEGQTGYFEAVFSAQKDVVIFPNTPRFLISGDSLMVTAKLANHLSEKIGGNISLNILDPLTGVMFYNLTDYIVSLDSNSIANFSWGINVEEDLPHSVKFVFKYLGISSGDEVQVEVPILSPKQLQRITRPFLISEHTSKKIKIPIKQQLEDSNATPIQFTLELAQNPLWFVIQALPYIKETVFESADQLMQRMFGYHLAIQILDKHAYLPELYSKVMLNTDAEREDLRISKTFQTPWNMDFEQKKKSKQEVMEFFNTNQFRMELQQTITKLGKYQHPDGGISWFPEGKPDLFLTLNLLEVCGRINKISGNEKHYVADDEMVMKATKYAKSQILQMVKDDSLQFPELVLYFAFVRSFYAEGFKDEEERKLLHQILKHFESRWTSMNIFQQAMIGTISMRFGGDVAKKIAGSLINQSTFSVEKGRYWNAGNGYRWSDLPVERQVALMEFLDGMGGYTREIGQMAHWLMMQKRLQDWNTLRASMSACYGIMLLDSPASLDQFDVVVKNSNGIVNFNKDQQKMGYFRQDWYGSQIDSTLSSWEFDIPKGRLAWGGLYANFWNKRQNIGTDAIEDIKLSKEIFKVDWTKDTLLLEKLDKSDSLRVGERIRIVLSITSTSSFDYLHLRDPVFSGLQIIQEGSGYKFPGYLSVYYQYTDENIDMFIDHLPKGNFQLSYDGIISHSGKFIQTGAQLSSHFAPEFSASSGSAGIINATK